MSSGLAHGRVHRFNSVMTAHQARRSHSSSGVTITKAIAAGIPAILFLSGCGNAYNTQLRRQSELLHEGMSFTEVTNHFKGFELLYLTNYPTPQQFSWNPRSERDHIEKPLSTNPTASWVLFRTPGIFWGWSDACRVSFDTNGTLNGYSWMYPH